MLMRSRSISPRADHLHLIPRMTAVVVTVSTMRPTAVTRSTGTEDFVEVHMTAAFVSEVPSQVGDVTHGVRAPFPYCLQQSR